MKNILCAILCLFLCVSEANAQTAIWAAADRSSTTTEMRFPVDTSAVSTPGSLRIEPANLNGIYFNSSGRVFASGLLFDSAGALFLSGAAQYCDENGASCTDMADVLLDSDIGVGVQAFDAGLLSIAGLTTLADRMIFTTDSDVYAVTTLTATGRALIDDASTSAQRTTLVLGTGDSPTFTGLTLSGLTTGSVIFAGASGVIAEDNAEFFYDNTDNRLGLGTVSPGHALHVLGNSLESSRIKITGVSRAGGFALLRINNTEASPTAVTNGNKLGLVLFQGHDGTVDTDSGARITALATENWTATAHGAKMQFKTVDNTTTGVDVRMTIDQNGHVGIGTDAPDASALLDISTTTLGLLFPRLTTAERDSIGSPVAGLTIYNTTTNTLNAFDSTWAGLLIDNIDVTVAQGGTGASDAPTARTNLGVDAAGTDNSTDVTLSGSGTYLSLTGQDIQVDLLLWTDDHTTGTDGQIPTFDASGNPAFIATGTNDQFLLSNGAGAASTFQSVGTDGQIIFNSNGSLISESDFKYNPNTNTLDMTGPVIDTADMPAARTADHTFALTDLGAYIRYDSTGSLSATVPPNSSVAFPIGQMLFGQVFDGDNTLTLVAGSGVTLETNTSLVYTSAGFGLIKTATDVWTAIGGD